MRLSKFKIYCGFLMLFLLYSCKKEMEEYYERPDWLKGNAYEVLDQKGNFVHFIEGCKKTGLFDLINGKGLCTVLAFDDATFEKYLKDNGYSSMNDIPANELQVLIGYHIVEFRYSTSEFLDFQINGVLNPPGPAGVNYKHKTFGKKLPEIVYDPIKKREVEVYNREKFLPVLSTRLMETKEVINYQYNYNYFFPESKWYGDDDKLYAANAGVIGTGMPSDNGYVYVLDQVIEPLRTVKSIMNEEGSGYSIFNGVYDRFVNFQYDKDLSSKYAAAGDSLFLYFHTALPKIGSEWTFNHEAGFSTNMGVASGQSFNAIIPDNEAMQDFLTNYYTGYDSYDEIPFEVLLYFINNHVSTGQILLPEEISMGKKSVYGDVYDFDIESDVVGKEMCGNGVFYGVNKVITPAMYKSVTAPLFSSDAYSTFRMVLHKTQELIQLINPDVDFTLFVPSNNAFELLDYRVNQGDVLKYGDEKFEQYIPEDDEWKEVKPDKLFELAARHIVPVQISDFNKIGYYSTKAQFNYLMTKDGGIYTMHYSEEPIVLEKDLGSWSNGNTYEIPYVIQEIENDLVATLSGNSKYSEFFGLLKECGMIELVNGELSFSDLANESAMIFALTNETIAANAEIIPTDVDELRDFLRYYVVSLDGNSLSEYILPGIGEDSDYKTLQKNMELSTPIENVYHELGIYQTGENNLRLVSDNGTEAYTVDVTFPMFATDGIVYQVDKILK